MALGFTWSLAGIAVLISGKIVPPRRGSFGLNGSAPMLDAWLNRTRDWLKSPTKLLSLPEQEFALWALCRAVKQSRQGPLNCPLTQIWGEPGSGRSSLVRQALQLQSPPRRRNVIMASAIEWSQWLADDSHTDLLLSGPVGLDLLICTELQELIDEPDAGHRLASWFDAAHTVRVPVIVTADRLPSQIAGLSPRLLNRLQGGLLAGIRPLCGDSKQRLWNLWTSHQAAWSAKSTPAVADPVITTAGQLRSRLVQRDFPEENPRSQPAHEKDPVSLEVVAEAVSRDFHLTTADLRSGARTRSLQIPRDLAMSLARELTPHSTATISRFFGCRSHTSVARSCSRLQQLLLDAPTLRQQLQSLRAQLRQELSTKCG